MPPDALAALDAAVEHLRAFAQLAYGEEAVAFSVQLERAGKVKLPIRRLASETAAQRNGRRVAILRALKRAERPLTRRDLVDRIGCKDNSRFRAVLQELVVVEHVVKRLPGHLYWLAERPMPAT